ncbi:TetR family transcriptional regulator [Streptomyces sp. ODS28]|uniref:TetR/AcrR family transcriptional regulator n=1 Tax=Streptomyces sp. ODS28 TaxID=3136688 RepID=UPI0031ED5E82
MAATVDKRADSGARARKGRPPQSEAQRNAVRLTIAREAVRLFAERGVSGTSSAEIARAAGVSVRTLWRHFPSKEECVRPLLLGGLDATARLLEEWPRDRPLREALEREPLTSPAAEEDAGLLRHLVRLTLEEPALRAVWLRVHHEAEAVFARVLARRAGSRRDALEPRVQAVMLNGALRVAAEEWARRDSPSDPGASGALRRALRIAADGLPI